MSGAGRRLGKELRGGEVYEGRKEGREFFRVRTEKGMAFVGSGFYMRS